MPDEKFTIKDLEQACDDLQAFCPFFPKDQRQSVMTMFRRMIPHKRALRWLIDELCDNVGNWPSGADLRGLLCSRFDAADGKDPGFCTLAGYTAAENEAKYYARNEEDQKFLNAPLAPEVKEMIRQLAEKKAL